jgi:hypothetical protein
VLVTLKRLHGKQASSLAAGESRVMALRFFNECGPTGFNYLFGISQAYRLTRNARISQSFDARHVQEVDRYTPAGPVVEETPLAVRLPLSRIVLPSMISSRSCQSVITQLEWSSSTLWGPGQPS